MNSRYHFVDHLGAGIAADSGPALAAANIPGRAVYADSQLKVLLLPFRAGQVLARHTTPHDAIMHVLDGRGRVTLGADEHQVTAGSWMRMAGGLPHSVQADTDLLLLLQVLPRPGDVPASVAADAGPA